MNYDRAMNTEYANFRNGVDVIYSDPARKNLYVSSRVVYSIIQQTGRDLMTAIRDCDFKADASDGIHNVDATMYQYIKRSNPEIRIELEQVEKLGESV